MERKRAFQKDEFYHIYNRGIDKRKIFFAEGDWTHFQRLLYICNNSGKRIRPERVKGKSLVDIQRGQPLVNIYAYAMMENHLHIIMSENIEGGISKFMSKLLTSYSMYMNKKYKRTGPLMCRPFRSKHIGSDEYFRWLMSYVHLNPIDQVEPKWKEKGVKNNKEISSFLNIYKYSSYYDYFINDREESLILNKENLPINIDDLDNIVTMFSEYTNGLGES